MVVPLSGWIVFFAVVIVMLILDLGVFNRQSHALKTKEALAWTFGWIAIALGFAGGLYVGLGTDPALKFLTGYIVEKALSLDNIFVFVVIFQYFNIPLPYQHRVLSYGIIGAIIMRGCFIGLGIEIIQTFSWMFYIFGLFLIFTAVKMLKEEEGPSFEETFALRIIKKYLPLTGLHGQKFFVKENQQRYMTPLFLALILIELSDVLFALDSVPAILAITTEPFIVYTSNIFAILGLRSLYFVLADLMSKFRYLKHGLSLILFFIGVKLLLHHTVAVPIGVSLSVIIGILVGSVGLSWWHLKYRQKMDIATSKLSAEDSIRNKEDT